MEAFLIQSLLVSVGSLLNEKGKGNFDRFIRETLVREASFPNSPMHSADGDSFSYDELAKKVYVPTETFMVGSF